MRVLLSAACLLGLSVAAPSLGTPVKRDGTCPPQPTGAGPVPTPDTASAFKNGPVPSSAANGLATPSGYAQAFAGQYAAVSAPNYQGYVMLPSFDPTQCAALCDQNANCAGFNMFMERAPSVDPDPTDCPNPPSYTYYKCSMWGQVVDQSQCVNQGQMRASFQVVIAGSYGFNKKSFTTQTGRAGPWAYQLQGNTQLSYSPGYLAFNVDGTNPAPGGSASAAWILDPSKSYVFSANFRRTAGATNCTLTLNGMGQPFAGYGNYNQIWQWLSPVKANLTVACPTGASQGLIELTAVTIFQYGQGLSPILTV